MELSFESFFSSGAQVGNLSYLLLIISMAMRDIFWLRVIAIFSGLSGIAYDALWLHNPVGVFWESCFTLVNLAQWSLLVHEKRNSKLSAEEQALKNFLFPSVGNSAFRKLLDLGQLCDVPARTELVRQGEPVPRLMLITSGSADITVNSGLVATCRAGDLVGEISFLTQGLATATVTTRTSTRFHSFDMLALGELLAGSDELNTAFATMCNTNLADKLVRTSESASR